MTEGELLDQVFAERARAQVCVACLAAPVAGDSMRPLCAHCDSRARRHPAAVQRQVDATRVMLREIDRIADEDGAWPDEDDLDFD